MQIHHYSPVTGEFISTSVARESPQEPGTFLMPAHATTVAPPELEAKQAAVFYDGEWSIVPDHRGERWYKPDGSEAEISEVNAAPHESWSETTPPKSAEQQREELVRQAHAALALTDRVALRCFKAGAAFPAAWQKHTAALRAIVNGSDTASTSLPAHPKFPSGT